MEEEGEKVEEKKEEEEEEKQLSSPGSGRSRSHFWTLALMV